MMRLQQVMVGTVAYIDGAEGVFGTSQDDSITGD